MLALIGLKFSAKIQSDRSLQQTSIPLVLISTHAIAEVFRRSIKLTCKGILKNQYPSGNSTKYYC